MSNRPPIYATLAPDPARHGPGTSVMFTDPTTNTRRTLQIDRWVRGGPDDPFSYAVLRDEAHTTLPAHKLVVVTDIVDGAEAAVTDEPRGAA